MKICTRTSGFERTWNCRDEVFASPHFPKIFTVTTWDELCEVVMQQMARTAGNMKLESVG
jgi:hypothetical protein